MRHRLLSSIALTAILAVASAPGFAQNAQPQVMSAPSASANAVSAGNSVGVIRSGDYYEDHVIVSCTSIFINCIANFATTPADKFLTITNVDCTNTMSGVPTYNTLFVGVGSGYARSRALPIAPYTYGHPGLSPDYAYVLNFNAPIIMKIGVSKSVYINLYRSTTGAFFSMDCTMNGTLSDPQY